MFDVPQRHVLWAALVLAGCGGGGGGANTPPSNPPSAQLKLDDANAARAADLMFDGIESALFAADNLIAMTANLAGAGLNPLPIACAGGTADVRYLDNDGSGSLTSGDETRVVFADCSGFEVSSLLAITSIGIGAPQPLSIDSLRGEATFDVTRNGDRARGRMSVQFSATSSAATWRMSAISFDAFPAGVGTESFTIDSFEATLSAAGYRHTFFGKVASDLLGGDVAFATEAPLAAAFGQLPTSGAVVLSAGGARVRLTPPTDPAHAPQDVELRVDPGSGQFGAPTYVAWSAVANGFLFGISTPLISQLSIEPAQPKTTDPLRAVAQVLDPSGGPPPQTTYVWRRNGAVIAGQASAILPAGVHRKGDVIEVTVTASEGGQSDSESAQVTVVNSAPSIREVLLSPLIPFTYDDVRAIPTGIDDADGDVVSVAYAWQRNSVDMPAVSGATFPAASQKKLDVIGVRVTVDDGEAQTFVDAAVTIRDSPPALSLLSPPPTQAFVGIPTGFGVSVTDADPEDDPALLKFIIDFGPAGMSVDPVTGVVTYTPNQPLFERSTDMQWGVTVNDPTAVYMTGAIEVVDPTRDYPLARTGIEPPYGGAGAVTRVGDFDGDGDQELRVLGLRSLYELAWNGTKLAQTWAYPSPFYGTHTAETMATGDVDGDGKAEIFLSAADKLVRLDGATLRVAATASLGALLRCTQLELANVNADSALELVCLLHVGSDQYSSAIRILSTATFETLAETAIPYVIDNNMMAIANVDADSQPEIILATGAVYDGASLADEWPNAPRFGIVVAAGDVDGNANGRAEIVGMDRDWTIKVYQLGNSTPIATMPDVGYGSLLVRDIRGDAKAEIVTAVGRHREVRVYRYDATLPAKLALDYTIADAPTGLTGIGYGNIDGDGAAELVWSGDGSAFVFAEVGATAIEWETGDPSFVDGPLVGGELATLDGDPALVFATPRTNRGYAGTRLLSLSPAGGDVSISDEIGFNFTSTVVLTTADYDLDGTDEALLSTAQGYSSYLVAYDLPDALAQWESTPDQDLVLFTAVGHADFTGDGRDELVALAAERKLYVYNLHDVVNPLLWQATLPEPAAQSMSIADLDRDGDVEIVVGTYNQVIVYSRTSSGPEPFVQTAAYTSATQIWDIAVGDTDGDGDNEVFVLTSPFTASPATVQRLDDTLNELGSFVLSFPADSIYLEELGFARKNLIVPTAGFAGGPSRVVALDAEKGYEIWRSPLLPGYVSRESLHYVDLSGNGDFRLSLGTEWAMLLTR